MAIQSASGNHESASSLAESLAKLNKLTSKYTDNLNKIQEMVSTLSGKELKGCLDFRKELVNSSKNSNDKNDEVYKFEATGIEYSRDNLFEVKARVNTLILYIDILDDEYGDLDGTDDTLEGLAVQIKKYQNEINKTLSGETKKKALKGMIGVVFASNKYDAKSMNGISKEKVLTNLDNWEGDLKFVRQDNGTYLVIKVGKDGSEVPMGYTNKKGKNKYYKAAKEKVLNTLKEKDKSSKEKNKSSKEKTTSSKEENIASNSNEVASNSIDVGITEDELSKELKLIPKKRITFSSKLTESDKKSVSKLFIEDLKKKVNNKKDLEGCSYSYWIERTINNGKIQKIVHMDATKVVMNADHYYETIRVAKGRYIIDE